MTHDFRPGQTYAAEGPGEWLVEVVFHGPTVIGDACERTQVGIVHLRNVELGYRRILRVDGEAAKRLTRI